MQTINIEAPVPFRFFAEIGFDFVAGTTLNCLT